MSYVANEFGTNVISNPAVLNQMRSMSSETFRDPMQLHQITPEVAFLSESVVDKSLVSVDAPLQSHETSSNAEQEISAADRMHATVGSIPSKNETNSDPVYSTFRAATGNVQNGHLHFRGPGGNVQHEQPPPVAPRLSMGKEETVRDTDVEDHALGDRIINGAGTRKKRASYLLPVSLNPDYLPDPANEAVEYAVPAGEPEDPYAVPAGILGNTDSVTESRQAPALSSGGRMARLDITHEDAL